MIKITNECNMELMARYPNNYFDLAIVDPPYGIDISQELFKRGQSCAANRYKEHKNKDWDKSIPNKQYFNELFRISKNQIVWGGNYMTEFLPSKMGWIVWDKMQYNFSFAHGELAWSSFDSKLKIFRYARGNESGFAPKSTDIDKQFANIHPTQKPIKLYEWLLMNYAKQGDKILDTHLGSGSIAIACYNLKFDLTACELDKDYFDASLKRLKQHQSQLTMF